MNCIQGSGSPLVVTHKRRQKISVSTANNNEILADPVNPDNSAVFIRDMCKGYGGTPVLKNLNMNVRKGTIYGLLGASGCGKTSLLSCVVGLLKWESGDIFVFGKRPGTKESGIPGKQLGYMPQDISLYNTLTITEMISFYGKIYNMPASEVEHNMQFLIKLLQLPPKNQLIGDMSGGQMRRASLALALVHCPDLLILDEPTVGLDPILRKGIWNHLYKIVSTLKTTVIITSHYIEECRMAHTIGFMRKGRLLVEDAPTNVLHTFKCELLEDVVLKLCRADESNIKNLSNNQANSEGNKVVFKSNWKQDVSGVVNQDELDGIFRKAVGFDCEISENLRRRDLPRRRSSLLLKARNHPIYHTIRKIQGFTTVMWLQFMRYPLFVAALILLPTIQGAITIATIGNKPTGMAVGIVNNEMSNWNTGCSELDLTACDFSFLSCHFIKEMKKDDLLDLHQYNSEEQARAAAQLGKLWGYISFPHNFSQHTVDLITAGRFAENETLEGSRIHMYLDMSQYIGSFFMIKNTYEAYENYLNEFAEKCEIGHNNTQMPIHFRQPVYGTLDDGYTEFLIPGAIYNNMLVLLSVMTSLIHIADKKQGTLARARVAGLGTVDILFSHMITQGTIALAQIVLWSLTCYLMVGFIVQGPSWLYFVICLTAGFCGAALGMLEGILFSDEVESLIFAIFITPLLLFYGGVFWPIESMTKFWQTVACVLPTTLPIVSMRSVITRGLGITHELVYPGVIVIVLWTLVLSICVIIVFRRSAK